MAESIECAKHIPRSIPQFPDIRQITRPAILVNRNINRPLKWLAIARALTGLER